MKNQQYKSDRLESNTFGDGEPAVLFLHGWGGDCFSLDIISVPISKHRRVISLSLPGFGRSPEPELPFGTWDYVDVVLDWLLKHEIQQVDVIGHSFGGKIAMGLSALYPELVHRLVLIASTGLRPCRSLKTRLRLVTAKSYNLLMKFAGKRMKEWAHRRRERLGSSDWRNASPVMRSVLSRTLGEDITGEMTKIKASTLLIFGSVDKDTTPESGKKMNKHIRDSKLVIIPGAGHYCFLDQKGKVLSEIWSHLNYQKRGDS